MGLPFLFISLSAITMLLHGNSRTLYFLIALLIFLIIGWSAHSTSWSSERALVFLEDSKVWRVRPSFAASENSSATSEDTKQSHDAPSDSQEHLTESSSDDLTWDASAYYEVQSSGLSSDKKWFPMTFLGQGSYNPNLVAHPWKNDTWYMIAQGSQIPGNTKASLHNVELVCEAAFIDNQIKCVRPQTSLAIAPGMNIVPVLLHLLILSQALVTFVCPISSQ